VDLKDALYPVSIISLTVVSMALFLVLAITVKGSGLRLYAVISAVVPAVVLVSARTLHLRLMGKWSIPLIVGITLIIGQLTICLFYFPLKPISFGLMLLGAVYGLISLAANHEEGNKSAGLWLEPGLVFSLFFLLSFAF
jgi:hypothetical protein